MKKMLLVALFTLIGSVVVAQKIKENKIDEFTGRRIISTSDEILYMKGLGMDAATAHIDVINGSYFLSLTIVYYKVFAIEEGAKIMFILEDGSVYEIKSLEYKISDYASSSRDHYIRSLPFISLTDSKFEGLSEKKITKMRIYMSDGYVDYDIKEKHQSALIKLLRLVYSIETK